MPRLAMLVLWFIVTTERISLSLYIYTFKTVNKYWYIYDSFNVIYNIICSGCLEDYIGKTDVGKFRLKDQVKQSI